VKLRTIRLDSSDTFIFPSAAEPGEWAISAAFVFAGVEPTKLEGRELAAFRGGFLGVPSLGWSTLAQVVEANEEERNAAVDLVARSLLDRFGAPDLIAARKAAEEEIAFAASLCDHPIDTLIAVHRGDGNDAIREVFRSLHPRSGPKRWHAFSFHDAETHEEAPEIVDLATLAGDERQ
jgi:hypothetical protein